MSWFTFSRWPFHRRPKVEAGIGLVQGTRFLCNVPAEAGQVYSLAEHEGVIVLNCEFGVYIVGPTGGVQRILTRAPVVPPGTTPPPDPNAGGLPPAVTLAQKIAAAYPMAQVPTFRKLDPEDGPASGSQAPVRPS